MALWISPIEIGKHMLSVWIGKCHHPFLSIWTLLSCEIHRNYFWGQKIPFKIRATPPEILIKCYDESLCDSWMIKEFILWIIYMPLCSVIQRRRGAGHPQTDSSPTFKMFCRARKIPAMLECAPRQKNIKWWNFNRNIHTITHFFHENCKKRGFNVKNMGLH